MVKNQKSRPVLWCLAFATELLLLRAGAAEIPRQLSRPDEKPADQTRMVKVFILMGQSNMVGMGDINPDTRQGTLTYLTKTEMKYPFLVDDAGKWTVRKDVYYYDARVKKGSYLSPISNNGNSIGPELGFGYVMGQLLDEPVLVLKSCIGNLSFG
jgi:alpha-galactosidase